MRLTRVLQGLVWAWRVGRINRGHHLVLSIVSGTSLFLLLLSLTASPTPNLQRHGARHLAARRIQQQADDYTGSKITGNLDDAKLMSNDALATFQAGELLNHANLTNTGNRKTGIPFPDNTNPQDDQNPTGSHGPQKTDGAEAVLLNLPVLSQPVSSTRQREIDTGIGQIQQIHPKMQKMTDGTKTASAVNLGQLPGFSPTYQHLTPSDHSLSPSKKDILVSQRNIFPSGLFSPSDAREALSQLALEIPRTISEKQQLVSAQERALAALQHGYRITEQQKTMLAHLSPHTRAALEKKSLKTRKEQDKAYIRHLRNKRQILPRKGGGEEIYSNPRMTVRFPVILKKLHPKEWEEQYAIYTNLTHHPWATSVECINYTITFYPPSSHSTRALASFPSSGNTWIRYLIEGATGIFTGSLYDDNSLTRKGLYGEGLKYDSGMTVAQKSHGYTTGDAMSLPHDQRLDKNHMAELSYQGIIVIRNPFKALISHRHLDVGGHTGYAPKAHFVGAGWASFVSLKIRLWQDFYLDWITRTKPDKIHITHYENLKTDPAGEMRKILAYLRIEPDEGRLSCLRKNTDGLFKRKPSKHVPLDSNPFTQELKDLVYEAIEKVNTALGQADKEQLPLDRYEIYDPREAKVAKYLRKQRS